MSLRLDDVVALLKGRRKREKHLAQALRPYEQATANPGEIRNVGVPEGGIWYQCSTCGWEYLSDDLDAGIAAVSAHDCTHG